MAAEPPALSALARAKVNLTLHVLGRRADGYHLLESLVVFPRLGDLIEVDAARGISLSLDGPQALGLGTGGDNLVVKAALALREAAPASARDRALGAAIRLTKRLPLASGVGGGSSDAATTLRLLARLWSGAGPALWSEARLSEIALGLGADTPACLSAPAPLMMEGIGERLRPAPTLPPFWLCLVNPGRATPTGPVFRSLAGAIGAPQTAVPARYEDVGDLAAWLAAQRNDLEAPAAALTPEIGAALSALRGREGCRLARMSGSGATCWGLFAGEAEAEAASAAIARAEPRWWCAAAPVEPA
ncbi:MAG: 4-(cytidine 5'-diphospho)-2-C-methyl-D-erythritol kinase [Pseudomonadota bacterium]